MTVEVVVAGAARGKVVVLDEPLSFWGGVDPGTGCIKDRHHPQVGTSLRGAIVVMARGRGSSSASTLVVELVRRDTAPAALVMRDPDEILATGSVVADELYGRTVPILVVDGPTYDAVAAAGEAAISVDGRLQLTTDP